MNGLWAGHVEHALYARAARACRSCWASRAAQIAISTRTFTYRRTLRSGGPPSGGTLNTHLLATFKIKGRAAACACLLWARMHHRRRTLLYANDSGICVASALPICPPLLFLVTKMTYPQHTQHYGFAHLL